MESPRRSSLDSIEQCKSEEVESKRWMDRASRYLTEGRFENAIRLLEKTENVFPNCKNLAELMAVTQVCYAATWRACYCARPYTRKLPDWYRVLKVDERADFDTIKKRYRQLALLLHPDKNQHVNSEGAFKLISEAYACLSDIQKRDIYNLERRRSFCANCNLKAQLQAAGHYSRPAAQVQTPQTARQRTAVHNAKNWAHEPEGLQNLRERAKATVNNLEREWGSKTSKWMQQLANVRLKYRNLTGSPITAKARSSRRPDPMTPLSRCQEEATRSKGTESSRSERYFTPKVVSGSKLDFDHFEVRRASTSDMQDERRAKVEENLDLLLRRLRTESSATAKDSPLLREFGVHTSTPEAGNVARPLGSKRVTRSSSVDMRWLSNDSGPGLRCMPKGRCLSKKDPFSPSFVGNHSTVHIDCTLPRMFTSDHKGQSAPKPEVLPKEVNYGTPVRSSSVKLENFCKPTVSKEEESTHLGHRSISRTASGTWTSRVKANPELFDDVFTTVSPSTFRTPIRRQSASSGSAPFVLKTPPVGCNSDVDIKTFFQPANQGLMSDQGQKRLQRDGTPRAERRVSNTEKGLNLTSTLKVRSNTADEENDVNMRSPLGSRSENVTSYVSKNRVVNPNTNCKIETRNEYQQDHIEDMEQKQKTDAINGILERLRTEAKTVAATLDRLRENVAAENTIRR